MSHQPEVKNAQHAYVGCCHSIFSLFWNLLSQSHSVLTQRVFSDLQKQINRVDIIMADDMEMWRTLRVYLLDYQ